jgi:hypothetical protein
MRDLQANPITSLEAGTALWLHFGWHWPGASEAEH